MTPQTRQQLSHTLSTVLLFVWGIFFLLFPLFFTIYTTDPFIISKEALLGGVVVLSLVLWGVKMVVDQQVRLRRTPFDVPILLFVVALLLSSMFAIDKADSLIALYPLLYAVISYFLLVHIGRRENAFTFLSISLLGGGVLSGLVSTLSRVKIYLLPFVSTHIPTFTSFGSYVDMAIYLLCLGILVITALVPSFKSKMNSRAITYGIFGIILLFGLTGTVQILTSSQKPVFLPFQTGFQTAFAQISQDSGRIAQGFFFGSGYGTYSTVFTRFKPASFNTDPNWAAAFTNSSSFVLELLATTGIIGILSYIFLLIRFVSPMGQKMKNPVFLPILLLFVLSFVIPFSFTTIVLLFSLLGLFALQQSIDSPSEYFDVELKIVALKKGVLNFSMLSEGNKKPDVHLTHYFAFVILLALCILAGYYSTTYLLSDVYFERSLAAAQQNSGTLTYKYQTQAITTFPYRSAYYRIFSQTNVALANSLLSLNNGASPSATSQQTALTLIQQSITAARQSTNLSPQDVLSWQNLASVYRSLIGLGQNAESFAIAANQQAVTLDPSNPQEYIALGGIYYQLGQYDNAIRQFQTAIALKSDYANAYYNLGHAYEQKQDTQDALAAFQVVKQLVATSPQNESQITGEINALQKGNASPTSSTNQTGSAPLQLQQSTTLPAQPTKIPLASPTPHQ